MNLDFLKVFTEEITRILLKVLLEGNTAEEITKILMGGSLTFIGLIFTSLGIILTMQDNWKTKAVRESNEFKTFLTQNVQCVISSIVIFILSIPFLFIKQPCWKLLIFSIILFCAISVCYYIIHIVISYKKLIILKSDNTKPELSIEPCKEDE